jgi:hypothetical protein
MQNKLKSSKIKIGQVETNRRSLIIKEESSTNKRGSDNRWSVNKLKNKT